MIRKSKKSWSLNILTKLFPLMGWKFIPLLAQLMARNEKPQKELESLE